MAVLWTVLGPHQLTADQRQFYGHFSVLWNHVNRAADHGSSTDTFRCCKKVSTKLLTIAVLWTWQQNCWPWQFYGHIFMITMLLTSSVLILIAIGSSKWLCPEYWLLIIYILSFLTLENICCVIHPLYVIFFNSLSWKPTFCPGLDKYLRSHQKSLCELFSGVVMQFCVYKGL